MDITLKNFDIAQICESGQCFRMTKLEKDYANYSIEEKADIYEVIAFDKYLTICSKNSESETSKEATLTFNCSNEEYETFWKSYFDIDTDYEQIIKQIDKNDLYLCNAASFGNGIRILKQDLWEMIISFIISQRNNIKRIRKCIKLLCEKYGEEKQINSKKYYAFPTPEALYNASIEDLRSLGLGYRDTYIKKTAEAVYKKEISLSEIQKMSYKDAKQELLKLCGVGEKVADCICLFSLHHLDAFPKDTHINKVLDEQYKNHFPFEKYQGYAGILQQYIFFYDLNK